MHLLPFDYCRDQIADQPSLSHLQHLIEALRAEVPNTLLFDAGDFLQGTPMADYLASRDICAQDGPHPIISAMNRLRYDAVTLGNHEFNFGLDFLLRALSGAQFPIVTSNLGLADPPHAHGLGAASLGEKTLMLKRELRTCSGEIRTIDIGGIGLAPPQLVNWDYPKLHGRVGATDIVETAANLSQKLRSDGADLIIALAHTGIGPAQHSPGMENAALPLAREGGVDLLILGHSHLVFPDRTFEALPGVDIKRGTIHGRPAVSPGHRGSHLGVIDLELASSAAGEWRLISSTARALPVKHTPTPHEQNANQRTRRLVQGAVAAAHMETRAHLRKPVGHIDHPLHSYFSQISCSPALQLATEAKREWLSRQLHGSPLAKLPVIAATPAYRSGGHGGPRNYTDLPAGVLRERHLYDLYCYPNTLAVLALSGQQVHDWLERAAAVYTHVPPGACDLPLIRPSAPGYLCDQIDGLHYEVDLSRPARFTVEGVPVAMAQGRVMDVRMNGHPLDPEGRLLLVTNSFRVGGGGNYPGASRERLVLEGRAPIRRILGSHIAARSGCADDVRTVVRHHGRRLRLPARASVWFDTGPGAHAHLSDIEHLNPEAIGRTEAGFLRLRLRG